MMKSARLPRIPVDDDPPLSKKQVALLKKRCADLDDPTRYVIVSPFSRRFCLYYVPSDDVFAMNDLSEGSLFKRRPHAVAIAKLLNRRRSKKSGRALQVIAVKKTPKGFRFLEDIIDPWQTKTRWKPAFRRKQPGSVKNSPARARPSSNTETFGSFSSLGKSLGCMFMFTPQMGRPSFG